MKKFLVSREAIIYLMVEAENEAEAMEKAFENYGLEDWEIEGADDDAKVEEYAY